MPHTFHLEPDVFVLGFSDDVRALLDHVRAEAPSLLNRITVVDPDSTVVDRLKSTGLGSICGDLSDPSMLREAGIHRARSIALFLDDRTRRAIDPVEMVRVLRLLSPTAQVFVTARDEAAASRMQAVGAFKVFVTAPWVGSDLVSPLASPAGMDRPAARQMEAGGSGEGFPCFSTSGPSSFPGVETGLPNMRARIRSWRFWALTGVTLLDGLIFVMPIALAAMVIGALFAPSWLRRAARFLEALATGDRGATTS
ncbi:MAG: NAD-binding protein [candidate division NC10 bacterium]|nr:NAD-binding protein [candidate division NC10 bacterium]